MGRAKVISHPDMRGPFREPNEQQTQHLTQQWGTRDQTQLERTCTEVKRVPGQDRPSGLSPKY